MNSQLKLDLDHIIQHAEPLLRELDGRTIFLTGPTGFYGKWMNQLFERRYPCRWWNLSSRVQELVPAKLFDGCDYLLHFAHDHTNPINNIVGMQKVLDFAVANGAKKVLYASSGAVYGSNVLDAMKSKAGLIEYGPTGTKEVLANTKRFCEALGCQYAKQHGFDFLIARGFSFVGPMMNLDRFAIGNFIRDGLAGGPIKVDSPNTVRSYMHAADLVIWLLTILLRGESCEPYNVGSEDTIPLGAVAQSVSMTCSNREFSKVREGNEPATYYVPDTTKARTELGLKVTIELEEAIERTIKYYRDEQK